MYYIDYHTHTKLPPDGEVPLMEMAEAAVKAGLSELCVTDHYDLVDQDGKPEPNAYDWAPALEQWREAAERYRGRLTIRLGMEFGSANRYPDRARETLDQPELDFVIGSLHNLTPEAGARDFYFVDYTAPEVCYACLDDYFAQMLRLAPLPDYDALGHIIYPLRYMCMRDGQTVSLDRYWEQIREILRTVVQTGHAIELNTYNGRTTTDWLPVLKIYKEVGGELITVGSDAHRTENVGKGVPEAYELLAQAGFRYVTLYEKRQPRPVKL